MARSSGKTAKRGKPGLVIWGASGHATAVADIVRSQNRFEVAGFLDDLHPEKKGAEFCGAPVLGDREQLPLLKRRGIRAVIVGIGNNIARAQLAELARAAGLELATAIHPGAVVAADVRVGAGTVIKPGAVIDPGVSIGENVIIASCVSLGHGCVVGDGARTSAGVTVAGNTVIGRGAWLAAGAVVIDRIRIGEYSLIGAGAVVLDDIPERVVAYGVPARVARAVRPDDY